ncbi:NLR family, CARD domain containing 5 isoform X2 [Betta splendens]|uniref:NLR family, CARD domain containing 5 isoform X2 n=1 Tax=Betta splendens TaxID=158456 RepID=A0A6P7MPU8_BETSP|nr:NLR family, CARD domain containing 5 isoform X2 [Betta splendens]
MDEELDPDGNNVNSVLAQESSELFSIITNQSNTVILKLCQMMPEGTGWNAGHLALSTTSAAVKEAIKATLEYFKMASAVECRNFLQTVCMLCEDIPMHLESRLMSVAGYANTDVIQSATRETVSLTTTDGCGISSPRVTDKKSFLPPSEPQHIKRQRIDYWQEYMTAAKNLLKRRWELLSRHLVKEVHLENVWINPRRSSRGRDRPDQTPGRSRTPDPDEGVVFPESKVTLDNFLQECTGKVTVVAGLAGSGKTLLMSCLGQQWADGLGPIPSSFLFIVLEFRQLNLLSGPLSLSELLFRHYLPPDGDEYKKRDVMNYLFSNPEQSCWVLDGYDEFNSRLTKHDMQTDLLDPETPLSVAELISGLLHRQLLPGCTVLVTCRLRDVVDLEDISFKVGQLLEWGQHEIKEYVENFFRGQGDPAVRDHGLQPANLILSNRHFLAMSSLPALCNICCICVKHLLLEDKEGATGVQSANRGEESGPLLRTNEKEAKELQTEGTTNVDHIYPTLTQVYLTVLRAFFRLYSGKGGAPDKAKSPTQQSTVGRLDPLNQYRAELCELTQLAWSGLEKHKILFMEDDVSQNLLELSVRTGLFSQVEHRHDGMLVNMYSFIHLTIQEFLAAVRIMSSNDVTDTQLKNRFSLKTRWTTKSDQKTVFTDSFHLYVCGLASSRCTQALVQLASLSFGTGAQSWVRKRQALVLKLLNKKCQSNTLTGPKILELCHCIQESQDNQLAKQFVDTRPTVELRNIPLSANDIHALAFVVGSVSDNGIGLDFGACSMEPEWLNVLSKCRCINCLSFHSRKYGDKFAEKLSFILPKFITLRKIEFTGATMTATGAASLASALQSCQHRPIEEINLSDNNLRDEGIRHIADVFTNLPKLAVVMLGRNNSSLQALDYLVGKMSQCLRIKHVHADGMKEVKVTFYPNSDIDSNKEPYEPTVSLLNQKWSTPDMQKLANSLACCPALSLLDLSGGLWDVEILKTLTQVLPKFHITKYVKLNDSCSSVNGLVVLTALLSLCPNVVELHIRLQPSRGPKQISIVFSEKTEKPAVKMTKRLSLNCCGLLPADLDRVWQSLGTSSDLTVLDLSSNRLGNKSLKKLLHILPRLHSIQEIDASKNGISMKAVFTLAEAFCSCNNLTQIHVSDGGQNQVLLKFSPDISYKKLQLKIFRINHSTLLPSDIASLCNKLAQCDSSMELDLSHSPLSDQAVKNLLELLPKMKSLRKLNISHSITSTTGALMLVSGFTGNQRVTSVELSHQSESFVHFDIVKAEQTSCRLTDFNLNCTDLEQLLQILQQGPRLSNLDLSSNQLDDEAVKCLVGFLPSLPIKNCINLSNNNLSQQGLLDVASTLSDRGNVSGADVSLGPEKRCLIWFRQYESCEKTLSVRDSGLKHEHLVRLAEIVSSCSSPIKLLLKDNSLQAEWIQDFVKALNRDCSECSVSIKEDWIGAEEAVRLMCVCLVLNTNIVSLRVHQNSLHLSVTSVSINSRDPNPSLTTEKIGLIDCAVHGHRLAHMRSIIQKCPLLTELDLDIEAAEFLCCVLPLLPNLSSLSISSKDTCPDLLENLAEVLVQSTSIQNLNLSGYVIEDAAAQIMTRMFPRLLSLNLSHCKGSATARLQLSEALGECVSLEGLCLDLYEDNRVCLARAIRKNKSLRSLKLNSIPMEPPAVDGVLDLLGAMDGLTQVENIELESWRMAEIGAEQLTKLLPVWTGLRKISLSNNLISDHSGDKLLEALISCSHLEELHLSSNRLGDLTATRMALVLPSLTHITVLDISENSFGCEGAVSLSKAIMCMKKLTKINLTSIGTSELCPIAASLAHCPLIQDVNLGWNNCEDNVALELARVLPSYQKLTRIDLESNCVSAVGVEALVKMVKSCPALQLIRLWRNKVSPIEAQRLSDKDRRLNFSPT